MKIRLTLALLLMLVVGGAVGYGIGAQDEPAEEARKSFTSASPVPAADPEVPVEIFEQDPQDPTLETGVPIAPVTLTALNDKGRPSKLALTVSVPVGWSQSQANPTRWMFIVPGNDALAFGLRIEIIAARGQSLTSAIRSRESELKSALYQESFSDLDITPDDSDGFEAVYVQGGYQRYSVERFYPGPDGLAYATVAVYGRARDLDGMKDLIERMSIALSPVQSP